MTTTDPATFADLCSGLPEHHGEVMTGHEGRPVAEVQDRRHGAARPAADHGASEADKYGGARA